MSFEEVTRRLQNLDALAKSLVGRDAFDQMHVLLPDPKNPEAAFIRAVSWLYCLYFEAGGVSLNFLRRLGGRFSLADHSVTDRHVEDVRSLRTELHHNLGVEDSDQATRTTAEDWRRRACGTVLPSTSEGWRDCYDKLVRDACDFLELVETIVRRIEEGGTAANAHIEEWRWRLDRSWPASRFDPLIANVKYQLGREALNVVRFRNRHGDRWKRHLELLEDDFDFEYEATRLIEKTLLDEGAGVLPITGRDVIRRLGVEPGPKVGTLLEEARRHFDVKRCTKEELLEHLRAYGA